MQANHIIIHLVHGTWPCGRGKKARERWDELRNGTLDPDRFWFVEGSRFCREIERSAGRSIKFVTFTWSGENTFTDRHEAATQLHKHLADSLRASPDAYHVVVAHSHGGTVAFEASTNPPSKWPQSLVGVLTMGTPFVALRESSGALAERVARATALRWGVALTVCFGLAFAGALALGGPGWFGSTGALLIAIAFIVILATGATGVDWLMPHDTRGLYALLAPPDPKLECPLIAYRAPGDEASLAISAAQFTDWLFGRIVWGGLIVRPIACLKRLIETFGAWLSVITTWTMTTLAVILYDWLFTEELQALWIYLIAGPWYAGIYLVLFCLVLLMVVPLILLPGMLTLRVATGPEALRYAGYATVDAESLPVGISASIEVLTLSDDERRTMALRHSLHELPVMRERIGVWLRQHCT